MREYIIINYGGIDISVPKEVADFLEQERKRNSAEARRDRRHLAFEELTSAESIVYSVSHSDLTFNTVLRNLTLEKLRTILKTLSNDDLELIRLRFYEEYTLESIGKHFGISKMAASKRLKKLLNRLRVSMENIDTLIFLQKIKNFVFLVYKLLLSVLISREKYIL